MLLLSALAVAACSAGNLVSELDDEGYQGTTGTTDFNVGGFDGQQSGQGGAGGFCEAVAAEATPKLQDADIIFAVDSSGSMMEESYFVRDRINAFSQQIIASGIDVRVIMIAEAMAFGCIGLLCPPGICVAPPLGTGICPNDAKPPHYHHPLSKVRSHNALTELVETFPSYQQTLRLDAKKYLVIITDDNATAPFIDDATTFINEWIGLDPSRLNGFTAHAIYCYDNANGCAVAGDVYKDLVNQTGGIHGNLALQDFQPIFDAVADQVMLSAGKLPCEYALPDNEELDPGMVNVLFTAGDASEHDLYNVSGLSNCDPIEGGWYYDNPGAPATIHLCPASCTMVSNDPNGRIDMLFGCATKQPPLR